jgi:hypothetical protein
MTRLFLLNPLVTLFETSIQAITEGRIGTSLRSTGMGMSFFAMPYDALTGVPKIGMNPLRILPAEGEYTSSRFSGPCTPV